MRNIRQFICCAADFSHDIHGLCRPNFIPGIQGVPATCRNLDGICRQQRHSGNFGKAVCRDHPAALDAKVNTKAHAAFIRDGFDVFNLANDIAFIYNSGPGTQARHILEIGVVIVWRTNLSADGHHNCDNQRGPGDDE